MAVNQVQLGLRPGDSYYFLVLFCCLANNNSWTLLGTIILSGYVFLTVFRNLSSDGPPLHDQGTLNHLYVSPLYSPLATNCSLILTQVNMSKKTPNYTYLSTPLLNLQICAALTAIGVINSCILNSFFSTL